MSHTKKTEKHKDGFSFIFLPENQEQSTEWAQIRGTSSSTFTEFLGTKNIN